MNCEKRGFKSKHAARQSVNQMNHTVRVYSCPDCHLYHIAKREYSR